MVLGPKDHGDGEMEARVEKMSASGHFDCEKACDSANLPAALLEQFQPVTAYDSTPQAPPTKDSLPPLRAHIPAA